MPKRSHIRVEKSFARFEADALGKMMAHATETAADELVAALPEEPEEQAEEPQKRRRRRRFRKRRDEDSNS